MPMLIKDMLSKVPTLPEGSGARYTGEPVIFVALHVPAELDLDDHLVADLALDPVPDVSCFNVC